MKLTDKHGSRLPANFIKVCKRRNGQFSMTIPSKLANRQGYEHGTVILVEESYLGLTLRKQEIIKEDE